MIKSSTINQAIEYILSNVSDNVTMEEVAEHCHLSKFYFARLFKKETGENVHAFIKRVKMEQSALKLKVERDRTITDIAMDYGYSASNYSSAFSRYHNMSPIIFRKELLEKNMQNQELFDEINSKIAIKELPDYLVAYERAIGNYSTMKTDWFRFTDKHKNDITEKTIFFDRSFDDPTITDKNRCIYDICMSIDERDKSKYDNTCILKGGKFVVYPFKGVVNEIFSMHQALIGIWLSGSHYELDERYSYCKYKLVRPDMYMEFDICIPIK